MKQVIYEMWSIDFNPIFPTVNLCFCGVKSKISSFDISPNASHRSMKEYRAVMTKKQVGFIGCI